MCFFFFSSRRRHTRSDRDWSSDVCSSDLALPGQILVSSMAQALAQRAQSELGERADRVKWVSHGRYRFKGVPAPILVHEVGEVGTSPLKQPPSGHKVWR